MASLTCEPNGRKTIQFIGPGKKRRSLRLGKMPKRTAQGIKVRVEHLVVAAITGHALDEETARWIDNQIDDVLRDRLVSVGLIPKREASTLAGFIDSYIKSRADVKESTVMIYKQVKRNLVGHFGPDKLLRGISSGDADAWRLSLIEQGMADNTVRRRCGVAKQFFRAALRCELIRFNPFADLKSVVQSNSSREYFITREEAEKVIAACPDAEWKLLFALSRYGGLRCPSEHLSLRWGDVDWEHNRITVHSPKTEHHSGGDSRLIPIFPELLPYLRDVFEQAEPGIEYIITRYRDTRANLRTQLRRILKRAGLEPWPKLFQNLRATRETELAEDWPIHVVCAWIGNSQLVAAKHYLQVTEEHFDKAACSALQNPVQHPADGEGNRSQEGNESNDKTTFNDPIRKKATQCVCSGSLQSGLQGLEP